MKKEDLPIGTKVVPHDKTAGKSFNDWSIQNSGVKYCKVTRHDEDGFLSCDGEHFNYSDVTLYEPTPKIKKSELLEKITGVNESVVAIKYMLLRKGVLTEDDFTSYIVEKHDIKEAVISDCKPAEQPHRDVLGGAFQKLEFPKLEYKPQFEVGKVYNDGSIMFYCTKIENEKLYGFGFNRFGDWYEESDVNWVGNFTEATTEEWFERLEDETNNKYKVGYKVRTLATSEAEVVIDSLKPKYFELNEFWIECKGIRVKLMNNGKWAEIIEEPQYQSGTLGAFWDGDWETAVDETSILTARLDKIVLGAYKPINRATCFQNFKPLKFD